MSSIENRILHYEIKGITTMKLVSVEQMRTLESEADQNGLSYKKMMENAGNGLAREIAEIAHSHDIIKPKILGLIGPGNNGGDALIALNHLAEQKWDVSAYLIQRKDVNDPLIEVFTKLGGKVCICEEDPRYKILLNLVNTCDLLIDGVLGTGFKFPLKSEMALLLQAVKKALENLEIQPIIVAVDCPSGVDNNTGEASDETISADYTICMAAIKQGLLKLPAYELVGEFRIVDIGFTRKNSSMATIQNFVADEILIRTHTIKRPLDAHKGTFGTAIIVAGSLNYTGAALLAGRASCRVGVGLVTMAIPASLHSTLAGHFPEATWLLLPHEMGVISSAASQVFFKNIGNANAVLIGCGLGVEDTTREFLELILSDSEKSIRNTGRIGFVQSSEENNKKHNIKIPPMVIDADGLKLLAKISNWSKRLPLQSVLTPHPGEMAILTGVSKEKIQANRLSVASHFAKEWQQVIVLKGAFTVIAAPDGSTVTIPVATSALSHAGSGDVLAGMIVGFCAQGMDGFRAAISGAWFHAKAGLLAADVMGGCASVMAGDLIEAIPSVITLKDDLSYQ
jgi:hydroxyethylthiazole kinase-like uncharacterized protein yjeF